MELRKILNERRVINKEINAGWYYFLNFYFWATISIILILSILSAYLINQNYDLIMGYIHLFGKVFEYLGRMVDFLEQNKDLLGVLSNIIPPTEVGGFCP